MSSQSRTPPPIVTGVGNPVIKPFYINPAGDPSFGSLTGVPPFIMRNVTARIFSLRANIAVLRTFCDQYLNMDVPPTIVHYAPALPYVYLMVLNYGSMSASSVQAQNLGWVAQHEVTFTVLLQRWRQEGGRLVFKDWVSVSPFIYVDDPTSLANGREIYGWNKVLGTIDSAVPLWITDPRARIREFDLSVVDFATTYAGESDVRQTLLQVDIDPPPTFTLFPPDPKDPWSPMWAVPSAISNASSFLGSAIDTALALRLRGYEDNRSLDALWAMGGKLGEKLKSALPTMLSSRNQASNNLRLGEAIAGMPALFTDVVTLKQFRNPEDASLACYQALVHSSMGVDRVNRVGLLGDLNLLRGDSSGGYSIRLHQLDSQPIIQTLGLQVDSWSDGDSRGDATGAVATLRPVLPAWMDLDLYYGAGNVICSRAHGSALSTAGYWLDEQRNVVVPTNSSATVKPPYYNNALGAATQPITGPFHFPDVTVQVHPLLADRKKIQEVLENYLNNPLRNMISPDGKPQKGWRFEPFGSYVYMMVTVYGDELGQMWSGTNNIGGFFDREVTFCIPVKWYDEKGELISVAVIEPFTFSNNGRAVATDREVNGYNTVKATIESPKDVWLQPNGPIARRRLLEMQIEVMPALNLGQEAQTRTLLEIDECEALPEGDVAAWRDVADTWGRDLIDDLKRKTYLASTQTDAVTAGKALALELLAHGAPLNRIILKQYRDGEQLTRACYQAIVQASSTITSVYDIRAIEPNVHVRLHRQPGNLIAEALGLKVKYRDSSGGEVVDVIQSMHPFWMRVGLKEDLATVACYRAAAVANYAAEEQPWQIVHPWFEKSADGATSDNRTTVEVLPDGATYDTPASPPRPLAGQQPYFKQSGETRVGAWLARVPADAPPLKAQTNAPDKLSPPPGASMPKSRPTAAGAPFPSLDVPPRPTGDTLALFSNAQDVEAWLDVRLKGQIVGAGLHLDVRNQARDWLRRALINELAWLRVCLDPRIGALRSSHCADDDPVTPLLSCEIKPSSITELVEEYSIEQLSALQQAASALWKPECNAPDDESSLTSGEKFEQTFATTLAVIVSNFNNFFDRSTEGIRTRGLAWSWDGFLDGKITERILSDAITQFGKMQPRTRHAFLMTLPKAAYPLLLEAGTFIKSPQYKLETRFQNYDDVPFAKIHEVRDNIARMGILSDLLELGLLDWLNPTRWRRYSYSEATSKIVNLDEVQLVIDNILASEWESRSVDARFLYPKAGHKPYEAMLVEAQLEAMAMDQGLERWVDPILDRASDLWVVPIPGSSDSIQGGYASGPAPPEASSAFAPADDAAEASAGDASGPTRRRSPTGKPKPSGGAV